MQPIEMNVLLVNCHLGFDIRTICCDQEHSFYASVRVAKEAVTQRSAAQVKGKRRPTDLVCIPILYMPIGNHHD